MDYEPTTDDWQARKPDELGMDADALADAVQHHRAHETRWRPDFLTRDGRYIGVADEPPAPDGVLGPVRHRGGPNGVIVCGGYLVAEWGDTSRSDMTFSVAKSYLAVLAGLAVARGLIESIDDPVRQYALDDGFDSPQNREVTWRHLLQQTSEWQGTLWDKPDAIDHNRDVGKSELGAADKGTPRALRRPGTLWEYNDVRVNRLSLSLLQVFRRPLPDVLRREIMDPIRGLHDVGVAALPELVDHHRRRAHALGARRLALGRRALDVDARSRALRALRPSRRSVGRPPARPGRVDRGDAAAQRDQSRVRALVVAQHRATPASRRAGIELCRAGCREQRHLDRPEHDLVAVVRWIDKPHMAGFVERVLASLRD